MEIIEIKDISPEGLNDFFAAKKNFIDENLCKNVYEIIENVKKNGINACIEYTKKFDNIELKPSDFFLTPGSVSKPIDDPLFEDAFKKAWNNITAFHKKQKKNSFAIRENNVSYEEKWIALNRVGCYIPGGSAPLVSTLLMTVVPSSLAGVSSINVCTPPDKEGGINPYILYACQQLNVEKIIKIGGAQGIAAMAFGIDGFAPVEKIVGPGNRYVTEAKRQVYGAVDIDMLAGPSEVCVVADESADSSFIAADILSQLEHDPFAIGTVISTSRDVLNKVQEELQLQKKELSYRKDIFEFSFKNIHLFLTPNLDLAFKIADLVAPEHLEIMIKDLDKASDHPFKAGAVFLGSYTPVAVGDFFGGTNHVLPTNGRAAFSSPLSTYDFYRRVQFLHYSERKLIDEAKYIEILAEKEQLQAHKQSISVRIKKT